MECKRLHLSIGVLSESSGHDTSSVENMHAESSQASMSFSLESRDVSIDSNCSLAEKRTVRIETRPCDDQGEP